MAYPELQYSITETAKDLPTYTAESTDKILARQADGKMGYILVSDLQVTLDGDGLATDASVTSLSGSVSGTISSLSGSIATKMANTSFGYVTGSFANDGAAAAAGVRFYLPFHGLKNPGKSRNSNSRIPGQNQIWNLLINASS